MTMTLGQQRLSKLRALAFSGWMASIFIFSALPGAKRPDLEGPFTDKWVHFVVYFILGALLFRWMLCWRRPASDRRWLRFGIIVGAAFLFSLTDEVHQYFVPGRVCDLADIIADTLGGAIAASLCLLPLHWQQRLANLRWNVSDQRNEENANGLMAIKEEKTLASPGADPTC